MQILNMEEFIKSIRNETEVKVEIKEKIIHHVLNIKEEIEEKENPNPTKVSTSLEKLKEIMSTIVLSHKTAKAFQWIYNSFNFISESLMK